MHDMICHCDKSLQHIILGILEQEPQLPFTEGEKETIKKCLSTGDHGDDAGDTLGDGDLDRLFADDVFEEEKDSG